MASNILLYCSVLISALIVSGQESSAFKNMSWCDTTCLCHDISSERLHCFQPIDIYSLMKVDQRKVDSLLRSNFDMQQKLTWCSEQCLCHKKNMKEFKCTDKDQLKLIGKLAPHLLPYLADDPAEIIELEQVAVTEQPMEQEKVRKEKKRAKKNRKKQRKYKKDEEMVTEDIEVMTMPVSQQSVPVVHSAGIFQDQFQLITKKNLTWLHFEMSSMREEMNRTKHSARLDRWIAYLAILTGAFALVGLMIFGCCSCCSRKRSKKVSTPSKTDQSKTDQNMKTNMAAGW